MAIESHVASATIISGKSNFKQDGHLLKMRPKAKESV